MTHFLGRFAVRVRIAGRPLVAQWSDGRMTATGTPQIEVRKIQSLRPYPGNARTHSKKQVRQIASSIQRFGFTNPVLISDDDEIIAGHGRVMAAKELGLATVPTLKLSHLSPDRKR